MISKQQPWRFLDTGKRGAIFNMALDEAVLFSVMTGVSPPTIRLFEWDRRAITLGHTQRIDVLLDRNRCSVDGIEIASRPTGGRAVFHENDLSYSVTATTNDLCFGGTILETYKSISAVLCDGLKQFGAPVDISTGSLARERGSASPCFVSTSRFELTADGKKLVGSAQRRIGNCFLQQGSILTGPGYEKIIDYMVDRIKAERYGRIIREK